MWRAITGTRATRMTAERDRFALLVTTVRVAAIAAFQLDEG
jgi:hypothetical protein